MSMPQLQCKNEVCGRLIGKGEGIAWIIKLFKMNLVYATLKTLDLVSLGVGDGWYEAIVDNRPSRIMINMSSSGTGPHGTNSNLNSMSLRFYAEALHNMQTKTTIEPKVDKFRGFKLKYENGNATKSK